jgi:ABC-type uncharacterized transport system ATPase component
MTKRCGFIALIGNPNAGKSTLLNQLVGGKVAIVSEKVQTTRTRVTGITKHKDSQLIFRRYARYFRAAQAPGPRHGACGMGRRARCGFGRVAGRCL